MDASAPVRGADPASTAQRNLQELLSHMTVDSSGKKAHKFWDTQPVPKLGKGWVWAQAMSGWSLGYAYGAQEYDRWMVEELDLVAICISKAWLFFFWFFFLVFFFGFGCFFLHCVWSYFYLPTL